MIDAAEIRSKAREFEILESNVQRDYLFGWLLRGFFTVSELKHRLFLKGGNAIRKGYIPDTRFSSDLDFGIPDDISEEALLVEVNKVCEFVRENAGVEFDTSRNFVEEKFSASEAPIPGLRVHEVGIYFKDFFGKRSRLTLRISMDLTRFDRTIHDPELRQLIHPYSDAEDVAWSIRCMKLDEIIATKLKCLLQREHAPDLFDYVFTIKSLGTNINKDEVVQAFLRKTIFRRNPRVAYDILTQTGFDYFRVSWAKGITCAKQVAIGVEEAIKFFIEDIKQAFGPYADSGYRDFAFFGGNLRTPIMKAGRDQTLLRIVYNGAERLVEPYSLKYQEKRSGEEKEFLYVWNVMGGSSEPGIRSLQASGFQSIQNTDEKFEPRYPIEVSKAGETPEDRYLFDINRPTKKPRQQRRSVFGLARQPKRIAGPRYVYQCSYCGKQVSKKSMESSLGPHKAKGGNYPCSGRWGVYITTHY